MSLTQCALLPADQSSTAQQHGFFEGTLEEGLPPRVYNLDPEAAAAVQVWTDAMWEPSQEEPARVAFVVRFPFREFPGSRDGSLGRATPQRT